MGKLWFGSFEPERDERSKRVHRQECPDTSYDVPCFFASVIVCFSLVFATLAFASDEEFLKLPTVDLEVIQTSPSGAGAQTKVGDQLRLRLTGKTPTLGTLKLDD